jgi:hypothetical protein
MGLSNNLGKLSNMITSTGSAVGIGTTSPSSLLNIIGGEIKWGFTSDLGALSYSGGNPMVQSIGATSLLFNTNGSERMRITSAGFVGIGTDSPNVSGQGTDQRVLTVQGVGGVWGGVEVSVTGNTSAGALNGFYGFTNASLSAGYRLVSYIGSWLDGGGATSGADMRFHTQANGAANAIERMRITSAGNVGIGTTSPTSPLTVRSTSRGDMLRLSISGSSSAGDATGITFGSATYDKAQIIAYNENTGNAAGYLTFWTGGSPATTDMTERMRLKSDGTVYIGGTSIPSAPRFGVIGSGVWDGGCIGLSNTGTGGINYTIFSTNSAFGQGASNLLFYNGTNAANVLIIQANGNYDFLGSDVSDRRLKQDIENINFGLNEIMALSPKSYNLKSSDNLSGENITTLRKRYGFIAQEVQPILPDTITGTETETEYLGLDYNGVLAVAVKAIQELKTEINELKAQING